MGLHQSLQAAVSSKEEVMKIRSADELSILIYPERILTRSAITPELLEKNFKDQRIIKSSSAKAWGEFLDAWSSTTWVPSDKTGDYRWALHLRSKSKVLGSIYIDRKAKLAVIAGKKYALDGGVLKWIAKQD